MSFVTFDVSGQLTELGVYVGAYLLQQGVNLAPLITNYEAPFSINDGNGKRVVWVEDGETFTDETGEIEIVDNVAEALIARAGQ